MKRLIGVNLATRPLGNQIFPWTCLGLLTLAVLVATSANLWFYSTRARDARITRSRVAEAEEATRDLVERREELLQELRGIDVADLNLQMKTANDLLRLRGFSWTRLFNDLEKVQPYRVQLETIQPNSAGEKIMIGIAGEAESHDDFLAYIDNLLDSPHFSNVDPRSEAETRRGGYRFTLQMLYHPPGPEERAPASEGEPPADGTEGQQPLTAGREAGARA